MKFWYFRKSKICTNVDNTNKKLEAAGEGQSEVEWAEAFSVLFRNLGDIAPWGRWNNPGDDIVQGALGGAGY